MQLNLLLAEAKILNVTGKSYHEKQVLKKLVAHHILMIRTDVFPLRMILDDLDIQYNHWIHDLEELFEKLAAPSLLTFKDIRKNLRNLSETKDVSVVENRIVVINGHLFIYYRMLI